VPVLKWIAWVWPYVLIALIGLAYYDLDWPFLTRYEVHTRSGNQGAHGSRWGFRGQNSASE